MKLFISIIASCCVIFSYSQGCAFFRMADLPEPVSNNAVTGFTKNNQNFIYSFGGIDSTKSYDGIHGKVFKAEKGAATWLSLGNWPDSLGKIGVGASTVKNKIYIIGGYSVDSVGNEVSSNRVHIFDPLTDTFLADGAPIPIAIDDHVQAVFKDSLIYVITGWSNTGNVADVQIYNPALNVWSVATSVPNNNNYMAFGATGTIVGNTIYYSGGASTGLNFPIANVLRKGIIDSLDPTAITWSHNFDTKAGVYRGLMINRTSDAILNLGAKETYNYDGLSYSANLGVSPVDSASYFVLRTFSDMLQSDYCSNIPKLMDLRGYASFGNFSIAIAGGMEENQKVSKKAYRRTFFMSAEDKLVAKPKIFYGAGFVEVVANNFSDMKLYDVNGKLLVQISNAKTYKLNNADYAPGMYHVLVKNSQGVSSTKLIIGY